MSMKTRLSSHYASAHLETTPSASESSGIRGVGRDLWGVLLMRSAQGCPIHTKLSEKSSTFDTNSKKSTSLQTILSTCGSKPSHRRAAMETENGRNLSSIVPTIVYCFGGISAIYNTHLMFCGPMGQNQPRCVPTRYYRWHLATWLR